MPRVEFPRNITLSKADAAVHEVMSSMPLGPGQMLLLGPKSVEILSTEGAFRGALPDMMVFERAEWEGGTFNTTGGRPIYGKGRKATRKT